MAPIPLPLHKCMALGQLLHTTRMSQGLSLQQMADALGITVEMYGRIERGRMMPNVAKFEQACRHLGLDPDSVVARLRDENATARH